MTDRFSPVALFKAHWASLVDFRDGKKVDGAAVAVLIVVPVAAAAIMFWKGCISQPAGWFTGVALLTSGLIGSFTYVAGVRLKLAEREEDFPDGDALDRQYFDETVVHILVAAYIAALTALILVIGMNLGGPLTGFMAALPTFTSAYLLLLVMMTIPRLYEIFIRISEVVKYSSVK